MRIALTGAPGSGKSRVARKLEKEFGFPVIDGYVDRLESRTDISLGFNADFVPNLGVAYERLFREWEVLKDEDSYILCGTVLESACYTSIWAATTMHLAPDQISQRQAINAFMDTLGIITVENWNYDLVFYLPPPQDANDLAKRLDYSLRDGFAILGIDHVPLTDEDKVAQAITIVKERLEQPEVTPDSE